jgi:hypothetical protein
MNQQLAEKAGRDFARERGLDIEEPVVQDLIRNCRSALGTAAYRNRLRSEKFKNQQSLFGK